MLREVFRLFGRDAEGVSPAFEGVDAPGVGAVVGLDLREPLERELGPGAEARRRGPLGHRDRDAFDRELPVACADLRREPLALYRAQLGQTAVRLDVFLDDLVEGQRVGHGAVEEAQDGEKRADEKLHGPALYARPELRPPDRATPNGGIAEGPRICMGTLICKLEGGSGHPDGRSKHPDGRSKHPEGRRKDPDGRSKHSDGRSKHPDGRSKHPDGRSKHPDGRSKHPDGRSKHSDGRSKHPDERSKHPDERSKHPDERSKHPDGRSKHPDGRSKHPDGRSKHPDERSKHPDGRSKHPDGRSRHPDERSGHPDERSAVFTPGAPAPTHSR